MQQSFLKNSNSENCNNTRSGKIRDDPETVVCDCGSDAPQATPRRGRGPRGVRLSTMSHLLAWVENTTWRCSAVRRC
eukprot:1529517-Prymnesium_polylepis.2